LRILNLDFDPEVESLTLFCRRETSASPFVTHTRVLTVSSETHLSQYSPFYECHFDRVRHNYFKSIEQRPMQLGVQSETETLENEEAIDDEGPGFYI
jgi:hypothetical protein